jgi:Protein of unknown function (DUF2786)
MGSVVIRSDENDDFRNSATPPCEDVRMTSRSAKRRDHNRQRELQTSDRASAEEAAWARWASRADTGSCAPSPPSDQEVSTRAFEFLEDAVVARMRGNEKALLAAVEALISLQLSDGSPMGVATVEAHLMAASRDRFADGWQPLDLVHVIQKLLSAEHRRLLVAVLGLERHSAAGRYLDDRWRRQLHLLGITNDPSAGPVTHLFHEAADGSLVEQMRLITDVRTAIELLVSLRRLPRLPPLLPPPSERPLASQSAGTTTSVLDEKVLGKVRALLAKAESTTFAEEADALTSKAQELMARHAIDLAMVESSGSGTRGPAGAMARRVHVEDPYFDAKSVLLNVVAKANRCTTVSVPPLGMVTVFGFAADLDVVELLFTSLLTQSTSAMIAAGSAVDRGGTSRTKSFRRAFILSFAVRIGERLQEATKAATEDATVAMGASVLPVLAGRADQVLAHQREVFPSVRISKTSSFSNAAGWEAGRAAADHAALQAHVPIAKRS